ncbi:MAG TPA: hypothetical protein VG650_17930 [Mycobacteriales bacterium]|nr:hypothetical protein [Mycobacteriales bacterium]
MNRGGPGVVLVHVEIPGGTPKLELAGRLLTAATLGVMAGVHLDLYSSYDYKAIPTIGGLFLVNGIAGAVMCLAMLGVPRRFLGLTALGGAGLLAGTALGLIVALHHPLFGFQDSIHAPHAWTALVDEIVGTGTATALAVASVRREGIRMVVGVRRRA